MVFETQIQARLRDVNLAGHVDNVEAIRIIDEARQLFLRSDDPSTGHRGLLKEVPSGVSELVGSHRVEYHAEMRFAPYQPFLVRMWVVHVGRSSFTLDYELRVAADHPAAISGEVSCVLWDLGAQGSWAIDDAFRARLEEHRGDPLPLRERPAGVTA